MRARILAALLALASTAGAAPPAAVVVDHARVLLSDVAPTAPADLAATDLCPAPPAGGSVLLTHDTIKDKLGTDAARVTLPEGAIRVSSAAKTLNARELADWLKPDIASRLRSGVTLVRVDSTVGATLSPRAVIKSVALPRVRQSGTQHETVIVELARDGETVLKVPVSLTVEVSDRAARADVLRGSRVMLVVRMGQVEVHADATTNADGDVGDVVAITVTRTSRAALAKLMDDKTAVLVEQR